VLAVVEPSFESLELALKVKQLAAGAVVKNTWAILNKITSDEIAARLKKELGKRGMEVIGVVHYDTQVFEACLDGRKVDGGVVSEEVKKVADTLLSKV
jgi:CO dehydrogenase nickel-insertion accessory protein CooC1